MSTASKLPVIVGGMVVSHEEYLECLAMLSAKLSSLTERPYFACAEPGTPWPADRDALILVDAVRDHYSWESGCTTCTRHGKRSGRDQVIETDRAYLRVCFRAIRMRYPAMRMSDAILSHRNGNPYILALSSILVEKYLDAETEERLIMPSKSILDYERNLMDAAIAKVWDSVKDAFPADAVPPQVA